MNVCRRFVALPCVWKCLAFGMLLLVGLVLVFRLVTGMQESRFDAWVRDHPPLLHNTECDTAVPLLTEDQDEDQPPNTTSSVVYCYPPQIGRWFQTWHTIDGTGYPMKLSLECASPPPHQRRFGRSVTKPEQLTLWKPIHPNKQNRGLSRPSCGGYLERLCGPVKGDSITFDTHATERYYVHIMGWEKDAGSVQEFCVKLDYLSDDQGKDCLGTT